MKKVIFFKNYTSVEQCFFICKLKPVLFLPDDPVLREGETGDNIYFLNKGELSVWLNFSKKEGYENLETQENEEQDEDLKNPKNSSCIKRL